MRLLIVGRLNGQITTAVKMARPALTASPFTAGPVVLAAFVAVGLLRAPLPWVLLALAPVSMFAAWRWRA